MQLVGFKFGICYLLIDYIGTCQLWDQFEELLEADCVRIALADFLEQNIILWKIIGALDNF